MNSSSLRIKTIARKEDDDCPEETEPMTPNGQYFGSLEQSCWILGVMEAEIPIVDAFVTPKAIGEVILSFSPRFSSIITRDRNGTPQKWKRVEVKVEDHIKIPTLPLGLSLESYDKQFDDYLSLIGMEELPQDRPLWEFHVFKYPTKHAPGIFIFKIHHALGDGYSLIGGVLSAFRRADDPSQPLTFPAAKTPSTNKNATRSRFCLMPPKVFSAACYGLWDTLHILRKINVEDDRTPIRSGDSEVLFKPARISTISLSLDQIKQIKMKLGVTINDVVVGAIFLATNLYNQRMSQGSMRGKCSTVLVPMNIREIKGYRPVGDMNKKRSRAPWGNRVSVLLIPIPNLADTIESVNPLDFIFTARKTIKKKRFSFGTVLVGFTLEAVRRFQGVKVATRYFARLFKNTSLTITNLAGPTDKMVLAKHPIKGFYSMVAGGIPQSLVVTVLSYMQTLRIALGVEDDYIDEQSLVECVEKAFDMISRAIMA